MIKIENRQTDIVINEEIINNKKVLTKANYGDLISICVNQQKQGGYSIDEISKRLRIRICILKCTKKTKKLDIELEDSDFNELLILVDMMKWMIVHQDIIDFVSYIKSLKK